MFPLLVWVNNLAHKGDAVCGAIDDEDHKWTVEPQNRDVPEGHKHDANACSGCSRGSNFIYIQTCLMHNLQKNGAETKDGWSGQREIYMLYSVY